MQSCIYEGQVRHSRFTPVEHAFRYRLFLMYVDLDELPNLFRGRWLWSASRAAVARFRRDDHVGPADQSLAESVRDLVELETGSRPAGPVRLLTNFSYFGYCFNPVSFYYCFAEDGGSLEAIVAEVNNTPWGERDTYVLPAKASAGTGRTWRFSPKKKMHVSPFMPMEVDYDWRFSMPGRRLGVHMANTRDGQPVFDATLSLQRTEITARSLARVLMTFPMMTVKVIGAIYWQALRLWIRRCPLYTHPMKKDAMVTQ